MSTEQERQLLATGEFSRRTGLSLKALRTYDENGLLSQLRWTRAPGAAAMRRTRAGPRG